jgi:hypothetical protein
MNLHLLIGPLASLLAGILILVMRMTGESNANLASSIPGEECFDRAPCGAIQYLRLH